MKKEIKFNSFYFSNNYTKNLENLFKDYELFRQKHYSKACLNILEEIYPKQDLLLCHSATGALELIALTLDIQEGDEVILPSFTFVSTANAFALRGAKLVFVDIEEQFLGLDPYLVEAAITDKTKAIIAVHYAGHACRIKELQALATKYHLSLIEDAAMCFGSSFKDQALGTFGDFGVISFDITKHISASQGGLLLINNKKYSTKAKDIYHVGTNRSAFEEGSIPYYEWISLGSKFQMPETNAVLLQEQLEQREQILHKLQILSKYYYSQLLQLAEKHSFSLMPAFQIENNFHEFYLRFSSRAERDLVATTFKKHGIEALFHYIPLHSSSFAKEHFPSPELKLSSAVSDQLLRLPLHTQVELNDIDYICSVLENYFKQ